MKTFLSVVVVFVLLGTWLVAQRPPPVATSTNQAEEILRALKQAMTNAPARTNAAIPSPNMTVVTPSTNATVVGLPPAIVPAGTVATNAVVPATRPSPLIVLPTATQPAPANVATQPAPNLTAPAIPLPGTGAIQPATPARGLPGEQSPAQAAPGAPVAPAEQAMIGKAMLQLQGMELNQFFEIYSMISGRTVLRPYTLQAINQQVTLKAETDWTKEEAIYAMDSVLALNGIAMIPIDEKFVKAVPALQAPLEGAEIIKLQKGRFSDTEQFVTQIVEVKTVKPSELAPLLAGFSKNPNGIVPFDNNQTIVLRDFASNVKRMLEVIEKVDVERPSEYKLEVIPIKYGKVSDLYNTMGSLISGAGGGGVSTAGAATPRQPRQTQQGRRGAGGAYGGTGGYRSGQGMTPQGTATPQNPGAAQNTFQQRLQQIVSKASQAGEVQILEDAKIVPDERSNKLLVFANKRDMEMITNIVAKVDVLLAQVLIEAIIMEVTLDDSVNLGVSMVQNPKRFGRDFTGAGGYNNGPSFLNGITNFPSGLPGGFSYFGKIGSDLDVAVNAIAKDSKINVMSRPRIQTSHAIPGNFFIGETVPYITSFANYGGYGIGTGIGTSQSQVEQVEIGFTLAVTPFITPDGLVVMELQQTFDSRGADVLIDGNPVPIINKRTADATLTVRDGQTIMMGGFMTQSKSKSKSGVPVLKDIPLLGALFRSKNNNNNRTELIVLMRAKVLERPEDASALADLEKSQLPGIQQAEKEFKEDDKKRQAKTKRTTKK